jgi:hypothetical protein
MATVYQEVDRKTTAQTYTSPGCFNELEHIGMAWVEA